MVAAERDRRFRVEFDSDSFRLNPLSENVTGVVFIRCGAKEWPESTWNDFVLSIVCLWRDEVEKLIEGKPARLPFMDGPLGFDILPSTEGDCRIRAWRERDGGADQHGGSVTRYGYEWECVAPLNIVIAELLRFAHDIFAICRDKGWGKKLAPFEEAYDKLQVPRN